MQLLMVGWSLPLDSWPAHVLSHNTGCQVFGTYRPGSWLPWRKLRERQSSSLHLAGSESCRWGFWMPTLHMAGGAAEGDRLRVGTTAREIRRSRTFCTSVSFISGVPKKAPLWTWPLIAQAILCCFGCSKLLSRSGQRAQVTPPPPQTYGQPEISDRGLLKCGRQTPQTGGQPNAPL